MNSVSNNIPTPPPGTQLLRITYNTAIKIRPEDSSQLPSNLQANLTAGENYIILGYAPVENHFRVTLSQAIPGFGYSGYVYAPHVQIWQNGQTIPYDPQAILLYILKTTAFKKQAIDAANLKSEERATLPAGMVYGVSTYAFENGHFKIAFTENIPKFGNTGYIYPDFVQFSRGGKGFNPTPNVTYQGPKEVVVNQPTQLKGTFDASEVAKISILAEDKFPLTVSLNPQNKTWLVNLNDGLKIPGSRWFRLKGFDKNGKIVTSQIINLNVTKDAQNVGQSFQLKVVDDTFFKSAPIDSEILSHSEKVLIKAGQTYTVNKYGLVDGHLKVLLDSSIDSLGRYGYFYERHVQLSKGQKVLKFDLGDVPDTQIVAQLVVLQNTKIKAKPKDSLYLEPDELGDLYQGTTYAITGYACIQGHFRVTLAESIPGFGNIGYIYWQHIHIKKDTRRIPFDPDSITATILQATILKKQPLDANQLKAEEKVSLPLGRVYGVNSYTLENNYLKIAFTEEFPNFGNTGYLLPSYAQFQRGDKIFNPIPNNIELNVTYFTQRDNPRFYWSTCNVTSIAMVFFYYGVRSKSGGELEDELLQWCLNYGGEGSQTDHTVLSALIRAYQFKTSFSTTRNWSEVKSELMKGRPVVLAGDFTASGHIVCLIGYNNQGFIVNDPWGDALTGYRDTEGARLLYPYNYMDNVAGPDGKVWAHFISR